MAGIDKIYLTKKNYNIYMKWIDHANAKNSIKAVLKNGCYKTEIRSPYAICNYSTIVDIFLANSCPLDFILKRLIEQYKMTINQLQSYSE